MKPTIPSYISDYINQFDVNHSEKLIEIFTYLVEILPDIPTDIGYKMPVFRMKGHSVYFAAFKNHIGFYPGSKPIVVFQQELSAFKTSKGAIQFALSEPLPKALIQTIARYNLNAFQSKKA